MYVVGVNISCDLIRRGIILIMVDGQPGGGGEITHIFYENEIRYINKNDDVKLLVGYV